MLEEWVRWIQLSWFDIKSRYRRTTIGPMWIVLVTAFTVGAIGFVYGSLFKLEIRDFVPYLAIGLILWTWMATSLIESGTSFLSYKFIILNLPVHPTSVVLRVVVRNFFIFLHNFIVVIFIFLLFGMKPSAEILMVIPGIFLVICTIFSLSLVIAFVCARFRDLQQALVALLSLGILVTPVIWSVEILDERRAYIAYLNPFTHLLDLIRLPLLGQMPNLTSWVIALGMFLIFSILAWFINRRYRYVIPFWL